MAMVNGGMPRHEFRPSLDEDEQEDVGGGEFFHKVPSLHTPHRLLFRLAEGHCCGTQFFGLAVRVLTLCRTQQIKMCRISDASPLHRRCRQLLLLLLLLLPMLKHRLRLEPMVVRSTHHIDERLRPLLAARANTRPSLRSLFRPPPPPSPLLLKPEPRLS
jgi:hypothetical protein